MVENRSQIKAGAIISYIQMGLNIIIGFLFTPVMIRLLGQNEYGLYNTVASTISMLSILRLGFNNSYIRYYSIYKNDNGNNSIFKLNGIFLVLFSYIGIVALLCGIYLTKHLELIFASGLTESEYSIARVLMFLLTLNLAISFPMSVFSNIISANEKFIFLKSLDAIKTVLGPMVSLPILIMGYGSIGMVTVTLVVSLIVDICFFYYVFWVLKNKFVFKSPEKGIFKDLGIYTFFIALELIVDQINWNIDKILLARFKGTAMVAIYSVGYSLYTYYQRFSSSISGVFTPRIHKIVNSTANLLSKRNDLTELFTKVGRVQFIILALIATGVVFWGEFFITKIWAGNEYKDSYWVAILLIIPSSIALIQNIGIEIQRAEYKHQFRSVVYTIMAIANLGISIVLCKLFGAIGSAIGTSISLILGNGLIMNIYYHKKCNIDIVHFWKSICSLSRGLIIPIILGVLLYNFVKPQNFLSFCIEVVFFSIVYFTSMYLLGMNDYEKRLFMKRIIDRGIK